VQNVEIMALTEKQESALRKLDAKTKIEIMHICADDLALSTVEEYCFANCAKKRKTYNDAKAGKLLKFEISEHIFLAINDK